MALALVCGAVTHGEAPAMRTLFKGAFSGMQEPCQLVVTNKADWEALWGRHESRVEPKAKVPVVDFAKETVVVVALGRKNSGGHAVEITEVRNTGDGVEVLFKTKTPKPGGLSIQALTAPIHIVAAPKLEGKVSFKEAP